MKRVFIIGGVIVLMAVGFLALQFTPITGISSTPSPTSPVTRKIKSMRELVDERCPFESNVSTTECTIELLDRVAAEREWKQRKIETARHPQINTYDMIGTLTEWQAKIRAWRMGFEKSRDAWCEGAMAFVAGSGTPGQIAECKITIELLAIHDLNNLYYERILLLVYGSEGILDFEPKVDDLNTLMKINTTRRGCVFAGEEECG